VDESRGGEVDASLVWSRDLNLVYGITSGNVLWSIYIHGVRVHEATKLIRAKTKKKTKFSGVSSIEFDLPIWQFLFG
jgi:hypothetical protein